MVAGTRIVGRTAVLILAALRMLAQEVEVTREGAYWVHKEAKTVPVVRGGRLQVLARGQIVVRGGSGDQIAYKLTQRVRARTEAEARLLFGSGAILAQALGPVTRIDVHQTSSPFVKNELELSVPHHLSLASLESQLGGGIEVYDLDGSVDARTPAGEIHADRIGGSVTANTGGGDILLGMVGGVVRCLTGAGSVTVVSAAGGVSDCQTGAEMLVRDAGGPVVLSNDGGNITVDRAASSVEAHAASGLIQVGYAGGVVTADTRGGSIQVGSARGVGAESAQGTVRVRGDSGPLNVSTMVGNILAELTSGARMQDSSLAAGSGDITVLIPSNVAVSVMVTNDMGAYPRLISDFSEVQRTRAIGFARTPVVAEGAIHGGGPMLHINAGTGVIYLRKTK